MDTKKKPAAGRPRAGTNVADGCSKNSLSSPACQPLLDAALAYQALGWSVIPIRPGKDKKPYVEWKPYQEKRATPDEIKKWWRKWPNANIGVVTGSISGIIVIDIDGPLGMEAFKATFGDIPATISQYTGREGGLHFLFKHPGDGNYKNSSSVLCEKTDVRGDGGYIVAAPSIHETGKVYTWDIDPVEMGLDDLLDLPEDLKKALQAKNNNGHGDRPANPKGWESEVLGGVEKGQRNDTCAKLAGKLLRQLDGNQGQVWLMLKAWNERNVPPLEEKEIRETLESIAKLYAENSTNEDKEEDGKKEKKTQADILIELGLDNVETWFEDQYKQPFARIRVNEHRENWPLKSIKFKRWLGALYYNRNKRGCNDEAKRTAIETLAAHAMYDGKGTIELYNRVAWKDGAIWYDLSNENWQAVKITSDGWELVDNPPILFRRFANQTAQVIPAKNGSIERLLKLTNLKNEESKLMSKTWLISTFIPGIPHAVPILYGPQGSAKTSFFRYAKDLLDPGIKKTDSMPRTPEDLIKKLNNNWLCPFDNISKLQAWQSDCICRAVTGEGYSQRMLYTDNEEMILHFYRVVALNGINVVATSPDLLDRCIILELERIPKAKRKKENSLQKEFDEAKPYILGGMLDVLSKAMRFYSEAEKKLKELPRMADFATWGYAIAEAMNSKGDAFIDAYYENIKFQNQQVIDSDPVASCLLKLMAKRKEWEGFPDELLKELETIAGTSGIQTKSKIWPKMPNTLTRRLNKLKVNLSELGFDVKTSIHTEQGNVLRVVKIPSVPSVPSENNNISDLDPEANLKQTEGNKNTFRIPSGSEPSIHAGSEAMKQLKVNYPYLRGKKEDTKAPDSKPEQGEIDIW